VLRHHTTSEMRRVYVRFETRPVFGCRIKDDFSVSDFIRMVKDEDKIDIPSSSLGLYSGNTLLLPGVDVPTSSYDEPLILKRLVSPFSFDCICNICVLLSSSYDGLVLNLPGSLAAKQ
jgi:hypothetical protein